MVWGRVLGKNETVGSSRKPFGVVFRFVFPATPRASKFWRGSEPYLAFPRCEAPPGQGPQRGKFDLGSIPML